VGAALAAWHGYLGNPRKTDGASDAMQGAYLGPAFSDEAIADFLTSRGLPHTRLEEDALLERVATLMAEGKVIGWLQGRMEFGPRALGARSILGDARSPKMQSVMNLKIKYRESFRPFAPSVLRERLSDYFDLDCDSPYMLLTAPVREERRLSMNEEHRSLWGIAKLNVPRSDIPAVTHIDYSARIQTVHRETNPRYHKLLEVFEKKTGCGVIVNTSFNVRGEPIACTPEDAYRCFMRTEMDCLAMGGFLLDKQEQPKLAGDSDWRKEFDLD
jgi:carbamoyltransferase